MNNDDWLLKDSETKRFTLFPIHHQEVYDLYLKSVACFWFVGEIDLTSDAKDWNEKLNDGERFFLSRVLAFFAGMDGVVNENLVCRFMNDVKVQEFRMVYGIQIAIETIHEQMYNKLIDTYITNQNEKNKLFDGINQIPSIKKKAEWALKWITNSESFAERLVAFAVIEGVFFSAAFCSIFWIKKRGLLAGLTHSNEFISRDESLHVEFAYLIYSTLNVKLSKEKLTDIVVEGLEIEKEFVNEALPVALLGMNSSQMIQYIEYVADRLLTSFDVPKHYNSTNPFEFMKPIDLDTKSNFFEKKVSEYSKMEMTTQESEIRFDADF